MSLKGKQKTGSVIRLVLIHHILIWSLISTTQLLEQDLRFVNYSTKEYHRELYQTPSIISSKLQDDEIGYYKIADFDRIFISNKWDTIYLTPNQKNEMTCWEILPARGSGGKQLDLKELKIEDNKNSLTLLDLVGQIEADIKQIIERRETYDD